MTEEIKLHTERLIVRTPQVEDAQDVFTLMKDIDTAIITGFTPMSNISEAEGKIRRGISDRNMFVITTKEKPGHVIGVFEVTFIKVTTIHGEKQKYEICYFLHKDFRGKGYMTEVVESMKRYLFMERQADTLIISVFPRNDASRRVAIKNGFIFKSLERKCGITGCGEIADIEIYILEKEEYLNPGKQDSEETIQWTEKQKWINNNGILYPIPGFATLLPAPGNGVFRIYEDVPTRRLGLEKIDETFTFGFKIYDLDCEQIMQRIIKTWSSELFIKSNKNLGVIFNGLKGTGKTIAAKLLSNRMGLPVIVISKPIKGMLEFIQSLCFECIILIDEAEKTFKEEQEVLLKMIDGVYNSKRKLYLLTTNKLTVDENLLGRPGRIRYIKEFGNLSTKAVNEVIDDNLSDPTLKIDILKLVDTLEISTIDILRAIIDECNIMGEVPSDKELNIPKAKFKLKTIEFDGLEQCYHQEVKHLIKEQLVMNETVEDWLMKATGGQDKTKDGNRNKEIIESKYDCSILFHTISSVSPIPYVGLELNYGTVTSNPDSLGFFTLDYRGDGDELELNCIIGNGNIPSLYRGLLF